VPDYLHNLASRITGPRLTVKPRLPSLFEPPRQSVGLNLQNPRIERSEERSATPGESTSLSKSNQPAADIFEIPRVAPQERFRVRNLNVSERLNNSRLVFPPYRENSGPFLPQIHDRTPRKDITEGVDAVAPNQSKPKQLETGHPPTATLSIKKESGESERLPYSSHLAPEVKPAIQPRIEPVPIAQSGPERVRSDDAFQSRNESSREGSPANHFLIDRPQLTAVHSVRMPTFESAKSATREIHVVIGTVTVQAIMPPQPMTAVSIPARTPPKLTLEQYLQQREARP
jgi:hypothetical protein